jgi:heterodisulfide reductase subunit A
MQKRPNVLVVGGGVAGLTAALNLAQRGVGVTLLERASELGGNARTVCCKAIQGKCQLCGGCLLSDNLAAVRQADGIRIFTETTVTRLKHVNGGFYFSADGPGFSTDPPLYYVDALVLATGFDHVDAHAKGPYGYGILPAVTTGEEMEKRLKGEGQGAYDGHPPSRVAFIQCVGSRDEHAGRGYCSQVCCRYGLRLARLLKSRFPQAEITVFKMDIQSSGRDFGQTWDAVTTEGIRLVSGLPAVIRRSTSHPDHVTFLYDDILAGQFRGANSHQDFDLVVLATGMQPRRDAAEVADFYGIDRDRYGFFSAGGGAGGDSTSTAVPGIFLAGSCQGPRSIAESVAHAQQSAEACYRYLADRIGQADKVGQENGS